jgi:hypothetical protein
VTAEKTLTAFAIRVRLVPRVAAERAATAVQELALANARAAAGGDLLLTGKKRKGIPLDVELEELPQPDGARIRVSPTPVGPWRWIDTGTLPHTIRRRRTGPKAKMRVHHPGTGGKDAWRKTVDAAPELVRPLVEAAVVETVQ